MSVLVCQFQGRFGNQTLQYLFARAFAERFCFELRTDPWIGERIFDISHPRPDGSQREQGAPVWSDKLFADCLETRPEVWNSGSLIFRGYAQCQSAMIYTKRQAQAWLKLRPEIQDGCAKAVAADSGAPDRIVCHRRVGDYLGYGYPICSLLSYNSAALYYGLHWSDAGVTMLCEEDPTPHAGFLPDDLAFMADFYRLMRAPTLLRGNSSFSWLAALLGSGLVLSPVIDGLEGGKEQFCHFVAGNHPRFANLDFVTDLYVAP